MAKFSCPHCRIHLEVGAELSQRTVACPNCQGAIQLPKIQGDESSEADAGSNPVVLVVAWLGGHICLFFALALATGIGAAMFLVVAAGAVQVALLKRKELANWIRDIHKVLVADDQLAHDESDLSLTDPAPPPLVHNAKATEPQWDLKRGGENGDRDDELVELRPARKSSFRKPPLPHRNRLSPSTGQRNWASPLKSNAPRDKVTFFGTGSRLDLGRGILESPLVYATGKSQNGRFDASLIDATLPVAPPGSTPRADLPYWPSYYQCSPTQRALYLDWLLGGRRDPHIDLGYVFIYFYGLERRVLIDGLDLIPVAHELLELMPIYCRSNSFRRYASALLWRTLLLAAQKGELPSAVFEKAIDATERWDDDLLSSALAVLMHMKCPLSATLAMFVCQNDPRASSSVVVRRHKDEFHRLFTTKYQLSFGDGLTLCASKRPRTLTYHPASATLLRGSPNSQRRLHIELPNILGLPSQFKSLVELWEQCIDDLKLFSRATRKTDGKMTAEVYESLPEELREGDHPEFEAWMEVWESNVDEAGWPIVPASALATIKGIEPRGTLTKSQCSKILATADAIGLGVEPDARITGKNYKWDERLTLFFIEDNTPCDVSNYLAASVLLRLGATVAQADGRIDPQELEFITEHLEGQFDLSDGDAKRLERLQYLLLHSQSGDSASSSLAKRLTSTQRRLVGEFLVGVVAIDEVVTTDEVKALRKAYQALRLEETELEDLLAKHGSVTVTEPPGDGAQPTSEFRLDMSAISRIMTETREVATILREAMSEEFAEEIEVTESETARAEPRVQERLSTIPAKSSAPASLDPSGLDPRYGPFLSELISRQEWPQSAMRDLADRYGVMVSGAIEAINEWSLDVHGDWLIEEGDPYSVRVNLLSKEG